MSHLKHPLLATILVASILLIAFVTWQIFYLTQAHSTFENYAAFRGCAHILSRTDTNGTCTTTSGETVTLVKFDNRWFLKGDLPVCMLRLGSYCLMNQP